MIFNRVTLLLYHLQFDGCRTLIAKGGDRPLYSMLEILDKIVNILKISISVVIGNIYSISFYASQLFLYNNKEVAVIQQRYKAAFLKPILFFLQL